MANITFHTRHAGFGFKWDTVFSIQGNTFHSKFPKLDLCYPSAICTLPKTLQSNDFEIWRPSDDSERRCSFAFMRSIHRLETKPGLNPRTYSRYKILYLTYHDRVCIFCAVSNIFPRSARNNSFQPGYRQSANNAHRIALICYFFSRQIRRSAATEKRDNRMDERVGVSGPTIVHRTHAAACCPHKHARWI